MYLCMRAFTFGFSCHLPYSELFISTAIKQSKNFIVALNFNEKTNTFSQGESDVALFK